MVGICCCKKSDNSISTQHMHQTSNQASSCSSNTYNHKINTSTVDEKSRKLPGSILHDTIVRKAPSNIVYSDGSSVNYTVYNVPSNGMFTTSTSIRNSIYSKPIPLTANFEHLTVL